MNAIKSLIIITLTATLIACASGVPISSTNATVPSGLSSQNIESSILHSKAIKRGWILKKTNRGVINGKLFNRGMQVEINITYSNTGYVISYVSSTGLKEKNGRIHPTYNKWIATLNSDIQEKLARI